MRYIVYFMPRSGSTQLCSILNKPSVGSFNNYELIDKEAAAAMSLIERSELREWGPALKKEIAARYYASHSGTRGFKVAYYQISEDFPGFLQGVSRMVDRTVVLVRNDLFSVALSQLWSLERSKVGKLPSITAARDDSDSVCEQIVADIDVLEYYLYCSALDFSIMKSAHEVSVDSLLVSYEEIFNRDGDGLRSILSHLSLNATAFDPAGMFVKSGEDGYSSIFRNWDELVQVGKRFWSRHLKFESVWF